MTKRKPNTLPVLRRGASPPALARALLRSLALLLSASASLPALADDYVLLTLLHTNDLHGRVLTGLNQQDRTRGGLARAATLVKRIQSEMPNVLLFDCGDSLHGTPEEFHSQGQSVIAAMNTLGYDAATYGNHEFDYGQDAAAAALGRAAFPFVSANVIDSETGEPWGPAKRYLIKEVSGLRIAIFGLTTLQTVELEWPAFISRIRFEDPVEAAARLVPRLREQADLVLCLSHLGMEADSALAAAVPGIDVILGGHSHTRLQRRIRVGETLIAQAGSGGELLGRVDLIAQRGRDGRVRVRSINGWGRWWNRLRHRPLGLSYPTSSVLSLEADLPQDPETVRAYQPFAEAGARERLRVVAEAREAIGDDGGPGDTPLARFAAEALRSETGAQLGIADGKMRGRLAAGPVTAGALWDVMGGYTGQNVLLVRVTGEQLRAALEQWAALPAGLAIGGAGFEAQVDPSRPEGQRVVDLRVDGRSVSPTDTFTLAGVMYVLRRFPPLMAGQLLDGHRGWTRHLLVSYARKVRTLGPPDRPALQVRVPAPVAAATP